ILGLDYVSIIKDEDAFNSFKNKCVALDGFYTLGSYLVTAACKDSEKNPGKVSTLERAQGSALRALYHGVKQLNKKNATLSDEKKIKYMVFHAAGNPYDENNGLIKYYRDKFGFYLTYGVYPALLYNEDQIIYYLNDLDFPPSLTRKDIANDLKAGRALFTAQKTVYNKLVERYN